MSSAYYIKVSYLQVNPEFKIESQHLHYNARMPAVPKFTSRERDQLAILFAQKLSQREIARRLKRNVSTISRELKRNRFGNHYVAIHAQAKTAKRKSLAGKRHPLKNDTTYAYVLEKLRWGWSPEQIAGRLQLEQGEKVISHEAIYQFIYAERNREKKLWEKLPRKQQRRRKKDGRTAQRGHIADRVSIHERPQEVETRQVVGHWEGDSVEGKAHKGAIHTQVERKTRLLCAVKMDDRTKEATFLAQQIIFAHLPAPLKKSTTVDNGKEFTLHKQFALPVFFADPYSSFQRGTNENTNGLLRRYLPKKTDFSTLTQEELNDIVKEINTRPRKCLDFHSPSEIFTQEFRKCCDSF